MLQGRVGGFADVFQWRRFKSLYTRMTGETLSLARFKTLKALAYKLAKAAWHVMTHDQDFHPQEQG